VIDANLVIARYNENITWAHEFHQITVYNKKDGSNLLPNVGREAHTYLTHIIQNYNHLNDITFFCQGDVFPHLDKNEFLRLKYTYHNGFKGQFLAFGYDGEDSIKPFVDHLKYVFFTDMDGAIIPTENTITLAKAWHPRVPQLSCDVNGVISPNTFHCKWGATFAVKKESIRSRSLEWYKKLIKITEWDNAPLGAHFLERTWKYVFLSDEFPYSMHSSPDVGPLHND